MEVATASLPETQGYSKHHEFEGHSSCCSTSLVRSVLLVFDPVLLSRCWASLSQDHFGSLSTGP